MRPSPCDWMSTTQLRIAELSRRYPKVNSLNQYLTPSFVMACYYKTRENAAVGVDGKGHEEFCSDETVEELLDRCKRGTYRAPPAKRAYIPKNDKEKRPLGIPTITDKVLQKAVKELLDPIYEPMFLDCSYGFRRGRSAHDCVIDLRASLMRMRGGFVLDIDIRKYFDSIPKEMIKEFVAKRVQDGVVNRMIAKWLHAGVMENGQVSYSDVGTPQGGVISPLLANIYLHYVLDEWFQMTVLNHIKGRASLFRYADDFVIVCKRHDDAVRILEALHNRLGKYGLKVHPEKSRLVDMRLPSQAGKASSSFDFLGFTFYWGKSRGKREILKVKTAKDRFARSCRRLNELCQRIRHNPVEEQCLRLNRTLAGHYNYYGVSFNSYAVWQMLHHAYGIWYYWLKRRGQKNRLTWERFYLLRKVYVLRTPGKVRPLWNTL